MSFKRFDITYTNPTAMYEPGQTVEGAAILETEETLTVRGIRLEFKGQTKVRWAESYGKYSTTYTNNEVYFCHEEVLLGKHPNEGRQTTDLPAGTHNYPFSFSLPTGLPDSFEGERGVVGYRAKVTVDRPLRLDEKVKKAFIVVNRPCLDLNPQPEAMTQVRQSKQKNFCCLCCKSGPLSATFYLPRKGYVLGDTVVLQAEIDNRTSRNISESYVTLIMETSFTGKACGKSKTVTDKTLVARTAPHPGIQPGGSDQWNGERLVIPPELNLSVLEGSKFIDVQYFVTLTVVPAGMALDLDVPLNIILGDVQHHQVADHPGFIGTSYTSQAVPPK